MALKAWIGHNATRYNKFNALPLALPHVLPNISISLTWEAIMQHVIISSLCYLPHYHTNSLSLTWLPRVTVKFIKNILMFF